MLKLKSVRYGYNDAGVVCGTDLSSYNVELMLIDSEGRSSFVIVNQAQNGDTILICDLSVFDILMNTISYGDESDKVESVTKYNFDYEYEYDSESDKPIITEAMYEGIPDEYRAAVAFARKILFMFEESFENEELLGNIGDLIKVNIDKELK